jgi:hypothetical protein
MVSSLSLFSNKNVHMPGLVGERTRRVFVLCASLVAEFPTWLGFERTRGVFVLCARLVET